MTDSPILRHLDRGTLTRREWGDGYKRAWLLAALSPETAKHRDWNDCPAEVMPKWLAALTPLMDDRGTSAAWVPMVRRYADLASRWHVLDKAAWRRALHGVLVAILEVARPYAPAIVDPVLELLRRPVGDVTKDGWRVARESMRAAWAAAMVARADVKDAWVVARAVADAAEEAVSAEEAGSAELEVARAMAMVAEMAAEEREAEVRVAVAMEVAMASMVAKEAAWDRMTIGVLDAIEAEIVKAETGGGQ